MHSHTIGDFAHDHNFLGDQHDAHANRTRWVVALTAAMMIVEIIAGLWTGSMALLADGIHMRSEEHTSELQSLMRISYAVFCLQKNNDLHKLQISKSQYH